MPIANTATVILTWWFAHQLVDASEVKNGSVDCRRETLLADHLLSDGGQTIDPTRGLLEEELVSPSIYSMVEETVTPTTLSDLLQSIQQAASCSSLASLF